eukprot:scaffold8859_cov116-Skeletonema_dohrnii-CCMP3373.AAC.6
MKFNLSLVAVCLAKSVAAFSALPPGVVNLSSSAQRDVFTMADWAASFGVQQAEGLQLTSYDGQDYFAATQQDIPAGTCVMYVPSDVVLSSSQAAQEFGGALGDAENQLSMAGLQEKIPLFRLFMKILVEYGKGEASPWYTWLNSLPRIYNTGASMTYACFDCLPPYAAWLALTERQNFVNFQKASKYAPMNEEIVSNVTILKWAYNVALTRSIDWYGERYIAPMGDMFNHSTETEAEISYDENGNCMVYATTDVYAGSPLRVSYGDPTNPTPLFASYGFLDETSPATFCKVYDVALYYVLKKSDPSLADGFYQTMMSGDEAAKSQYHEQYWQYTKEEMQKHVDGTLRDLDKWSTKANGYDLNTHPRVPLILAHNEFVKETFLNVKNNLDYM